MIYKSKTIILFIFFLVGCGQTSANSRSPKSDPCVTETTISLATQVVTPIQVETEAIKTQTSTATQTATVEVGSVDYDNTIDVERTYILISALMGREPTVREVFYMTIWSEYWLIQEGSVHQAIGQEAIARSYYHFCGTDGCTEKEFFTFLTGYEPWFGKSGYADNSLVHRANKLYSVLINELNYNVSGELLFSQIDEILDISFATEKGWTNGKENNKPSQWLGACLNKEKGTYGYEKSDYAIVRISFPGYYFPGGATEAYFYFFTRTQEMKNGGVCDVP